MCPRRQNLHALFVDMCACFWTGICQATRTRRHLSWPEESPIRRAAGKNSLTRLNAWRALWACCAMATSGARSAQVQIFESGGLRAAPCLRVGELVDIPRREEFLRIGRGGDVTGDGGAMASSSSLCSERLIERDCREREAKRPGGSIAPARRSCPYFPRLRSTLYIFTAPQCRAAI